MGATKYEIYTPQSIEIAKLFKSLGHPARVMVLLEVLNEIDGDISTQDLLQKIQLSNPSLSRHLKLMKDAGVLKSKILFMNNRTIQVYRVNRDSLDIIRKMLNFSMLKIDGKVDPKFDRNSSFYIHYVSQIDWGDFFKMNSKS